MSQDVELLRALEEDDIGDGENIELHEKLKVLSVLFQDNVEAEKNTKSAVCANSQC